MSDKIPLDSQEFKDKYTSETDTEYGVIFIPNIPGLPVLDSNGNEIVGYKKSVPENSFQSLLDLLIFFAIGLGLVIFDDNGPYNDSTINGVWKYLHSLFIWFENLF